MRQEPYEPREHTREHSRTALCHQVFLTSLEHTKAKLGCLRSRKTHFVARLSESKEVKIRQPYSPARLLEAHYSPQGTFGRKELPRSLHSRSEAQTFATRGNSRVTALPTSHVVPCTERTRDTQGSQPKISEGAKGRQGAKQG